MRPEPGAEINEVTYTLQYFRKYRGVVVQSPMQKSPFLLLSARKTVWYLFYKITTAKTVKFPCRRRGYPEPARVVVFYI